MKLTITCSCGKSSEIAEFKANEYSHGEYLSLDCEHCKEKTSIELHAVNITNDDVDKPIRCTGSAYCANMPYGDKCKTCDERKV